MKKTLRYSKDQILQIYKGLGNFISPLDEPSKYEIKSVDALKLILNAEANVVLNCMRDLPPIQAHHGNKSKMVNSVLNSKVLV